MEFANVTATKNERVLMVHCKDELLEARQILTVKLTESKSLL